MNETSAKVNFEAISQKESFAILEEPPYSNNMDDDDVSYDVENLVPQTQTLGEKASPTIIPNAPPVLPTSIALTYNATKPPKETLQAVYRAGQYKAGLPLNLLMVQSTMAGVYIAMAGHLYVAVGGGVIGAAVFPTGLIAVVLTSAELFTGDALVFVASVLGGKVSFGKLMRNWTVSWIMNFAGCLLWAVLLAYASNSLEDLGRADLVVKIALKKANQPWVHIFLKGIGANFMVCVGVWQATCAEEVAGKILALWFPISAFVMMGFDHVVANQFLIPVGMMYGADISISHLLFKALLPASLGNIVGGGLCVGAVYWYVYDTMTGEKKFIARIKDGWSNVRRGNVPKDE